MLGSVERQTKIMPNRKSNSPTRLNRRSFLQTTTLAAAPFILPSHIWSAETKPNDRITLGFIGTGKQGRDLMGGFLRKQTQVVAVCDVDKARREDTKARAEKYYSEHAGTGFKGCDGYNDFRELLARK